MTADQTSQALPGQSEERSAEMTADTRDDGPEYVKGVGERDLMFGMTVGVVMAFAAIALAIIFSL